MCNISSLRSSRDDREFSVCHLEWATLHVCALQCVLCFLPHTDAAILAAADGAAREPPCWIAPAIRCGSAGTLRSWQSNWRKTSDLDSRGFRRGGRRVERSDSSSAPEIPLASRADFNHHQHWA